MSHIRVVDLHPDGTTIPTEINLIRALVGSAPLLYGRKPKGCLLAVCQLIGRLHGLRGRRRRRILQTYVVRNLGERGACTPRLRSKSFPAVRAVAGGTRPDVPAFDAVAPSYSGTEMMPLLTVMPSPTCFSSSSLDQPAVAYVTPPSSVKLDFIAARGDAIYPQFCARYAIHL